MNPIAAGAVSREGSGKCLDSVLENLNIVNDPF